MAEQLRIHRSAPVWAAQVWPFDPEEHSWELQIRNEGSMVGSFVPLALEAAPGVTLRRLALRVLPGFESRALVNPGEWLYFELIAEPDRELEADEQISLELLYSGVSTQTDEWFNEDRDPKVQSLSITIPKTRG